jgi:SOS regulatory protein LexA
VVPEEHPSEVFSWEACQASLGRAHSAFKGRKPNAASALWKAFADASRMAEHCHDQLLSMDPEPLPKKTFEDWKKFLTSLYNDAWKVYPKHSNLVKSANEEDLQTTFSDLYDAAETALFALLDLQAMYEGKPSQRKPIVGELRKLVTELEAAKAVLGPQPEASEAHEADDVRQAGKAHQAGEAGETPTSIVPQEAAYVPQLGRIAAGGPIIVEESIEDILPLPKGLVGEGTLFLLVVDGDSMINAAIADGDWVVVRAQPKAENGEIVAAMIDGEATIKTFKQSDNHIWLVSHNPVYPPISGDQATILGKVVAVLRRV